MKRLSYTDQANHIFELTHTDILELVGLPLGDVHSIMVQNGVTREVCGFKQHHRIIVTVTRETASHYNVMADQNKV